MRIVQAAHHETSEVEKKLAFFKSTVELINEKFGGIEAVEDLVKIAKLKEQSVGNLMSKLDTCIVSSWYLNMYLVFNCSIYSFRTQRRVICNASSASSCSLIQSFWCRVDIPFAGLACQAIEDVLIASANSLQQYQQRFWKT